MGDGQDDKLGQASGNGLSAPRFRWATLAWWLPACGALGAAVAWLACVFQETWAPLVAFPVLAGLLLGAATAGLMRLGQVGHRPTLAVGALLAVTVAVAGRHYGDYWSACEPIRQAREAFGDLVPPSESFVEFLQRGAVEGRVLWGDTKARGAMAWLTWAVDGLLLGAAALFLIVPAWRQPYCDQCRSWFRTIRRGPLAADTAAGLAAALGESVDTGVADAQYRLVACAAGCTVAGFELSWQGTDGKRRSAACWLNAEDRNEVMRRLDGKTE